MVNWKCDVSGRRRVPNAAIPPHTDHLCSNKLHSWANLINLVPLLTWPARLANDWFWHGGLVVISLRGAVFKLNFYLPSYLVKELTDEVLTGGCWMVVSRVSGAFRLENDLEYAPSFAGTRAQLIRLKRRMTPWLSAHECTLSVMEALHSDDAMAAASN